MSTIADPLPRLARAFLERLPSFRQLGKQLHRRADGCVAGDWDGQELGSAFQPIVDATAGRLVGREAFLRFPANGAEQGRSPWSLFSTTEDDLRVVALDRLARTVHLLNALVAGNEVPLFLNVHGRLLASVSDDHGWAFRRVVDALGTRADNIVIETPAEASAQPELLAFVLRNYRNNGFRVAVNVDSPAQWQGIAGLIRPQFVKIDCRKLGRGRERIEALAALCASATLIVTHIEEASDNYLAERVWQQGYAYGVPGPLLATA